MARNASEYELPQSIVTIVDLARLQRELAAIDEFLLQASVRRSGDSLSLPRTTRGLEEIAQAYGLNLLQESDRRRLIAFFKAVRKQAPVVHISFAADPSPLFLSKLIAWFRKEVHPQILLQVGLQPSIAAGCVVRTANKYFDFSLRRRFLDSRQVLLQKIMEEPAQ